MERQVKKVLQQYLAELKKISLLMPEEEKVLWTAYKEQGDMESRRRLIEQYQPLVFKATAHWRADEQVLMDIIQEGTVGLIEAVENYDHTRGVAFSFFAMHRIRGRILNYVGKEGKTRWFQQDFLAEIGEEKIDRCLAEGETEVALQAEQRFLVDQVRLAMGRLPPKEQLVLNGMYMEELEAKELAADLNMSSTHIYRLQKQGIRRIRGMLSRLMQYW